MSTDGELLLGDGGTAQLNLTDGGLLTTGGAVVSSVPAGGSPQVTVEGQDTYWLNSGEMTLGDLEGCSQAIMQVDGGASVETTGLVMRPVGSGYGKRSSR